MKMKKVFAVLASSVLVAGSLASMAACGGGAKGVTPGSTTLNIADYAKEFEADEAKSAVSLKKVIVTGSELDNAVGNLTVHTVKPTVAGGSSTYNIYNIDTDEIIDNKFYSKKPRIYGYYYFQYGGYREALFPYVVVEGTSSTSSGTYYSVVSEYGTIFDSDIYETYSTSNSEIPYIEVATKNVNIDNESAVVHTFTAKKRVGSDKVSVLFREKTVDGKKTYEKIREGDIDKENSEEVKYDKGDKVEVSRRMPVYEESLDYPVEGDLSKYEYSVFGKTVSFFYDDEKKNSVTINSLDDKPVFAGNYMYWLESTRLPSDAIDGYNVFAGSSSTSKRKVTLNRYDFIAGTKVIMDTDYVVLSHSNIMPLYNYSTKSYDAICISGIKTTDGVACSDNSAAAVAYVTDAQLNVAYDVTDYNLTIGKLAGVYKMGETSATNASGESEKATVYGLSSSNGFAFVDKDLNAIMITNINNVNAPNGIVKITDGKGNYGFAGYDGTVKIAAKYSNFSTFFGGIAYAYKNSDGANGSNYFVNVNGNETKIDTLYDKKVQEINVYDGYGVYEIVTELDTSSTPSTTRYKYEYFDFSGKSLKSFITNAVSGEILKSVSCRYYIGDMFVMTINSNNEETLYRVK